MCHARLNFVEKMKNWSNFSTQELLKLTIRDLNLSIEDSSAALMISSLKADLKERGFRFCPQFFISDGWFVSLNHTAISIPFYLLHPRLTALELEIMGTLEGHTARSFHKLIRHELGHAIDHAYRLQEVEGREELFGSSQLNYPESYLPKNEKLTYVRYLGKNYASAHPDEDWAETFAFWFDYRDRWQTLYPHGKVRRKLDFMHLCMQKIKTLAPVENRSIKRTDELSPRKSLHEIYQKRLKEEQTFYKFQIKELESILVKKKHRPARTGLVMSKKLSRDGQQVLSNLQIYLWRKGYALNIENTKNQKILVKHLNQKLHLYIGKEKNNILM